MKPDFQKHKRIIHQLLTNVQYLATRFTRLPSQMNRYLSFLLILSLFGCAAQAQADPFERAQAYFAEAFPSADFTEWSKRSKGYVVSSYDLASNRSIEVVFNRRGQWQQTTFSLENDEIRSNIMTYLDEHFQDYFLTAYEVRNKKKKHRIGLIIDTPEIIYTLLFNSDGQLVERYEEGIDG